MSKIEKEIAKQLVYEIQFSRLIKEQLLDHKDICASPECHLNGAMFGMIKQIESLMEGLR